MSTEDEWLDVWWEYRSVFRRVKISEANARRVVTSVAESAQSDMDTVADALKEFLVRATERGENMTRSQARTALAHTATQLLGDSAFDRHVRAVQLFGVRAEDLGADACMLLARMTTEV